MMLLSLYGVPGSVRGVERHLVLQTLYQDSLLHIARVIQKTVPRINTVFGSEVLKVNKIPAIGCIARE
jgi:hypothetical protein